MALEARAPRASTRKGLASPRLAPPIPATSLVSEYEAVSIELGIHLYPWQKIAARYFTGTRKKSWAFREVVIVVARQNGKSELLIPRIVMGLRRGESILHTAQNRDIPRKTFLSVAGLLAGKDDDYYIRKANGQEEIVAPNGGRYKLVAPNASSRGETADLVLIDEVREQRDQALMDAMLPTITARKNPQTIYLSNAGDEESVVLNDLRRRMDADHRLAYLEWSAGQDRSLDDREGWAEANPALGHGNLTEETLEYFRANRPPTSFETEHLCRWVLTMRPRIVSEIAWANAHVPLERPNRALMGISMDASGRRASAAISWRQSDGSIGLRVVGDWAGDPIDTAAIGLALRKLASEFGVLGTGFDDWTDKELAKYLPNAKAIIGKEYANASENFARVTDAGQLHWDQADEITDDLTWTARKAHELSGAWQAIKAKDDRPITAALAAIRAVWMASGPKPAIPKVY